MSLLGNGPRGRPPRSGPTALPQRNRQPSRKLGAHAGRAYVYAAVLRSEWTSSPTYDPATNTATTPGRADFRIVDVADPAHPVELFDLEIPGSEENSVHDPKLRGDTAVFSWYALGVVVADLSHPGHPHVIAQFVPDDATPNPEYCDFEGGCSEIWGVSCSVT